MHSKRSRWAHAVVAAMIVVGIAVAPEPAFAAGCLTEFADCGDCAEAMLLDAIREVDPGDMIRAYLYGVDCEIDFVHCMLYADHHSYGCDA